MRLSWLTYTALVAGFLLAAFGLGFFLITLFREAGLGIFIAVAALMLSAFIVAVLWSITFGAPFVPVPDDRLAGLLRLADLKPGEVFFDLGSGDGRVLIEAARRGARAEGWEINPYLCLWTALAARLAGVGGRVKVHWMSYDFAPYEQADVIAMYLLPSQMKSFEPRLRGRMRSGSRVVAASFKFPTWPPAGEDSGSRLYLVGRDS